MRTYDEINADINAALSINDAAALLVLAQEMQTLGTRTAEAAMWSALGTASRLTGDNTEALEHYHRALAIHEEHGERSGVASVTGNIGIVQRIIGDYPAALEHYHRSLAILDEIGHRSGVASTTGNIGIVHSVTGDYPSALEHYHRSLELHEELGDRTSVATVTNNIGNVYRVTGDHTAALECFHRALALHEELGNRSGIAIVTSNIGSVCRMTGDHTAALENLYRALAINEELGDRAGVASKTSNIVGVHLAMGSDVAAHTLLQAMDTMQIDNPIVRIESEHSRAALQDRSGDLGAAAVTLRRALNEAHEHGLRSHAGETHKLLRDLALKQNDLAGYVEHNNEYTRITEEINGRETTLKLAMQAKQREIDAREREHAQHMAVLHSTLPKHIADRVARSETVNDHYDNAAVIFLDIVGFTELSSSISSQDVITLLDNIFTQCDAICEKYSVTKIKTIGDSYMAVAFETANTEQRTANVMPSEVEAQRTANSVVRAANAAIEMMNVTLNEELTKALEKALNKPIIEFRVGIHCGPVTAGVIGTQRMQYDVWGDTVNVASRMESTSEPRKIQISGAFAALLPATSLGDSVERPIRVVERGTIEVKGKGMMKTFWLESP